MKSFEVAEYVPSKFQVIFTAPVYNTRKSDKIVFAVEAKYNYGNPVKGTVTIKYSADYGRYMLKTFPIDGKAIIELGLNDMGIKIDQYLHLYVTVLEELTGKLLICI
jgi:hypothetical protein